MKALTCEMCGSTNLIKEGGVFVCQSCGTKYSVEEAKKMMVEGTVDVKGTVKVDTSDELKNLYEIARRAKDSDNSENATKYYDMILVKDPSSWEANFYVVYYKAMSCTIGQIVSAGNSVMNCLPSVIDLVESNVAENEKENVFKEIQARCSIIAHMLSNAAESTYLDTDVEYRNDYFGDFSDRVLAATFVCHTFGNIIEEKYQGKYSALSVESWKDGIKVFPKHLTPLLTRRRSGKNHPVQLHLPLQKHLHLAAMLPLLSMAHTIAQKFGLFADTETLHWMKHGMDVCL